MRLRYLTIMAVPWWLVCLSAQAQEVDWSGYLSVEPRYFFDAPLFPEQPGAGLSASAVVAPEFRYEWNDGKDRITVVPFLRYDTDDDQRSHADLREANWQRVSGPWAVLVGLGKVFWGVTESRHLVDIVNQTDFVEDIDEEDKLGQPMIFLERWTDVGTFSIFLLPGFRERTFPAYDARLRGVAPVDTNQAEYQSGAGNRRMDLAARWSQTIADWDVGFSGFYGTSREPRFLLFVDGSGRFVRVPLYEIIGQVGIDAQYTNGSWLWKLEAIGRKGPAYSFGALVGGFEYTFYSLLDSTVDLGLVMEYLYDGRGRNAPPTIYGDDLFLGLRLALNDTQDTAILAGAIMDTGATIGFIEAERRLSEAWKLELEARLFIGVDATDPLLGGVRDDSFVTLRMARYF